MRGVVREILRHKKGHHFVNIQKGNRKQEHRQGGALYPENDFLSLFVGIFLPFPNSISVI
jgi:hypothetical protein